MATYTFRSEAQHLASMARQFRFAAAGAINDSLFVGQDAAVDAMSVFDRPTPFVQRGVRVEKAARDHLVGMVHIPTESAVAGQASLPAGKPLLAEVHGGARRFKRSEILLQRIGVLPRNWYAVPGPAADIDAYGNMTRAQILHLLSYFKAFGQVARSGKKLRSNITDEGRAKLKRGRGKFAGGFSTQYFVIGPGEKGLRPGIYLRQAATSRRRYQGPAQRVRAVLFFVTAAQYKRLYAFEPTVAKAVGANFANRFHARLEQALATARA
jgi:hypothetical protein